MVSIVVPTIDEAANLPELATRIDAAMAGMEYELLIIDDGSRDGTPAVCAELANRYPLKLHIRQKPSAGLSGAVLHGFSIARGDIFVVMDGDLQHPPESIPLLIAPLLGSAANFVLGSRRVEGGHVVEGWGWRRRANSAVARLLATPLTGRVRDPMSGFFALSRTAVPAGERLNPVGYKIALELICKREAGRIAEVPIDFASRAGGSSKLSASQGMNYLRHLMRLYCFALTRLLANLQCHNRFSGRRTTALAEPEGVRLGDLETLP